MGIWAIVPAAGRGTRLGGPVAKQFLRIGDRTVLEHTLDALLSNPLIDGAMVALTPGESEWAASSFIHGKPVLTCDGGATRAASVLNALRAVECGFAVVHDAARPMLNAADLTAVIEEAIAHPLNGSILATRVADTLKQSNDGVMIDRTVDRETLWRALTPQVFEREMLINALENAFSTGATITDDSSAMELSGVSPRLVEGRADNVKITTAADLSLADFLLRQRAIDNAIQ